MFAINTSYDFTRKDTPFFLVHGWDAKTIVKAVLSRAPGSGDLLTAYKWRLQIQRQHEYAMAWAQKLQSEAKERRAHVQNERWKTLSEKFKLGFDVGDAVWLYLARIRPGLTKKLAHLWHRPFRILGKSDDYRNKLEVEGTEYHLYSWVHVSRLTSQTLSPGRSSETLGEVTELDEFDAALLPEDSWEADKDAGEFEVEEILDMRWAKPTKTSERIKQCLVRWTGYAEPTWVHLDRMKCEQLIFEFDQSAKAAARF